MKALLILEIMVQLAEVYMEALIIFLVLNLAAVAYLIYRLYIKKPSAKQADHFMKNDHKRTKL